MYQEAYRLLSRGMRYVFILIAGLFFLLTVIWMRRDQRRWKKDRKMLPDAGNVGELVDIDSLRRVPVPREGTIGSSPRCDIRVVGRGVKRRHADVRFAEGKGLMIIPAAGRKVTVDGRTVSSPVCAGRGSRIKIGSVMLTLRLFDSLNVPAGGVYREEEEYDPLNAVTPGAEDGWAEMAPLPEDRIDGGGEDRAGDEYGEYDSARPFDGVPMMPDGARDEDGTEDYGGGLPFDGTPVTPKRSRDRDGAEGYGGELPFDGTPVIPKRPRDGGGYGSGKYGNGKYGNGGNGNGEYGNGGNDGFDSGKPFDGLPLTQGRARRRREEEEDGPQ